MPQSTNPLTLKALASQMPPLEDSASEGIDIARWLLTRAETWPASLEGPDVAIPHLLCRRIAVRGEVPRYEPLDTGSGSSQLLARPYWALLIGILLAEAGVEAENDMGRGTACKCLNAALQALERVDGTDDVPCLDLLKERAYQLTERIMTGGRQ